MKKPLLLLWLLLSGCSGSFLEIYPETTLSEGKFYRSETEFILLVNGCYVPMQIYEKLEHWVLAELIADNGSFQYNSTTGDVLRLPIDQFISTSNNTVYATFWNLSYNGITRCNKLLAELNQTSVPFSKQSLRERCRGEALFLRALYYFNLVRQFGGVPLVIKPLVSQEAVNVKRSTESQVYDQIIADLKASRMAFGAAADVHENGRASEWAALSLLGKVYLTRQNYAEAVAALKPVIESGKYSLLANYADLFNPASKDFKETIFAIQFAETSQALSNRFIFWFAPWTSAGAITLRPAINMVNAGWNQPTDDLISAFEAGDKRKDVSVKFWTGRDWDNVVRPIPYCAKYKPPVAAAADWSSDNLPVLRYADVLLLYAEALNRQGNTGGATSLVEQVRRRAGLTTPLTDLTQETLNTLIAKERQVEFCFENQRWYDLKRTGKALAVMTAHGAREKAKKSFLLSTSYQITETKLLAPIPAEQILINRIEQNPGY